MLGLGLAGLIALFLGLAAVSALTAEAAAVRRGWRGPGELPAGGLGLRIWLARAAVRRQPWLALRTGLWLTLALGCWVAAPNAVRSGGGWTNESSAIGTLRSIAAAEATFRDDVIVDQDGNGSGEYGWLGELSGTQCVRGPGPATGANPYIARILGQRDAQGRSRKCGYHFAVFLRDAAGAWQAEPVWKTGAPPPNAQAAPLQEAEWICYAWPEIRGKTGNRAFMVNQEGEVYATSNTGTGQRYTGTKRVPVPSAALQRDDRSVAAGKRTAADGGTWTHMPQGTY